MNPEDFTAKQLEGLAFYKYFDVGGVRFHRWFSGERGHTYGIDFGYGPQTVTAETWEMEKRVRSAAVARGGKAPK